MSSHRVAVIGAGLAGLACARRLSTAGHSVQVFDKARAVGGRMATRRGERAAWDHGAQYFTASDPGFAALVESARAAGEVAAWEPRWPGGEQQQRDLWVGIPGSSALPRYLARELDVTPGKRIVRLSRAAGRWALVDDQGGESGGYDAVVLAMPAPQAATLAEGHSQLGRRVAATGMAPCWAVLVAFEQPFGVAVDADWSPDEVLPWIARNTSKPRRGGLDAWVLHADAEWSRRHFDADPATVQEALLARMATRLGAALPPVAIVDAHRWRYARVTSPLGEACLLDSDQRLGFCGDWCLDARVEAAYLSGDALGRRLAGESAG